MKKAFENDLQAEINRNLKFEEKKNVINFFFSLSEYTFTSHSHIRKLTLLSTTKQQVSEKEN